MALPSAPAATSRTAAAPAMPRLLAPFAAGHCANDLAPVGMLLVIPAFGAALGLSPIEIGLLFTLHSAGSALAFLPAGVICDHVANRGALLTLTFFWVGLGYFAASFAGGYWSFAALIVIAGMGDAVWHPIATGVLAQAHRDRRAYALGVHALGGHVSEVLALLIGGAALSLADWRVALQLLALPALIMGVAFLFLARRVPRGAASRPTRADAAEIWRCWSSRGGLRVLSVLVLYNMALFAILTMTPVFLQFEHGFGWRDTALALAAMMLIGALAQPGMGRLSDRIGRRPVSTLGLLGAAAAAAWAWATASIVATLLAIGAALTLLVAVRSVMLARAVDHAGGREGVSLGLAFLVMDGVGAAAAVAAGALGETDLSRAFLLGAMLALGAAMLAMTDRR